MHCRDTTIIWSFLKEKRMDISLIRKLLWYNCKTDMPLTLNNPFGALAKICSTQTDLQYSNRRNRRKINLKHFRSIKLWKACFYFATFDKDNIVLIKFVLVLVCSLVKMSFFKCFLSFHFTKFSDNHFREFVDSD